LKKLSGKYNKTISQIALNWLISKQRVVAIPKSVNIEHIKENLGAIGWKMDKDDIKILEQISEKYQFKPLIYQ
jgi:diketogulonate reductase-like aldo/keto reductase